MIQAIHLSMPSISIRCSKPEILRTPEETGTDTPSSVGRDNDVDRLFRSAMDHAKNRVIVKRSDHIHSSRIRHAAKGKIVRYDVYETRGATMECYVLDVETTGLSKKERRDHHGLLALQGPMEQMGPRNRFTRRVHVALDRMWGTRHLQRSKLRREVRRQGLRRPASPEPQGHHARWLATRSQGRAQGGIRIPWTASTTRDTRHGWTSCHHTQMSSRSAALER